MTTSKSLTEKYKCRLTADINKAIADATVDKGGKGEGFRPHQFLEAALAACMNMTVRMAAGKKGIDLNDVEINVDLKRTEEETKFCYSVDIKDNLPDETVENIIAALEKCPVKNTLSKKISFELKN